MTSKISDTLTPESQKSTGESAKDQGTGMMDKAASSMQPESQKSTGQKAQDQSGGMMQGAKDTLNSASESVSNAMSGDSKFFFVLSCRRDNKMLMCGVCREVEIC